jgi:transposase InsO family protein
MNVALTTTETNEPFECVAVDNMGPLKADKKGNKYIIVAIDTFTRFVELKAAQTATANEVATFLLELAGRYGAPKYIRSDSGPQYAALIVRHLTEKIGSMNQYVLPYRPQANGIVERANGEVARHLRAIVQDSRLQEHWSMSLPLVQRILNANPHSATGIAPLRLLFADAVTPNRQVLKNTQVGNVVNYEEYLENLEFSQRAIIEARQMGLVGFSMRHLFPKHWWILVFCGCLQ